MKECITHHYACDCREEEFSKLRDEYYLLRHIASEVEKFLADPDHPISTLINLVEEWKRRYNVPKPNIK